MADVAAVEAAAGRLAYAAVAGRVLRCLREGRALSQAELASRADLSTSSLSRFETGQSLPDMYEVYHIALALGVTPSKIHDLAEVALGGAVQLRRRISPGRSWRGVSRAELAGLAAIAVAGVLPEAERRASGSPRRRSARSRRTR